MHLNAASRASVRRHRGFSLIEVMVALVICAIGLLGLAKMAALGLAETNVSSMRSLVALEAGGMAASMHANRGYWSSTSATAGATISGPAPTVTDPVLAVWANCYQNYCAPSTMAARDVQGWGGTLNGMIPGYSALIICTPSMTPVTCTITVTWAETAVAVSSRQTGIAQGTATQPPTYTLYVQP